MSMMNLDYYELTNIHGEISEYMKNERYAYCEQPDLRKSHHFGKKLNLARILNSFLSMLL